MGESGLTLSQRFQFDSVGFMHLKGVLTPYEVESCKSALFRMKFEPEVE
jgi:hypothetical protein